MIKKNVIKESFSPKGHNYLQSNNAGPSVSKLTRQRIHTKIAISLQYKLNFNYGTVDIEYHKYKEKDKALERTFQAFFLKEPSLKDTISIFYGLKPRYELHHGVHYNYCRLIDFLVW